MQDTNITTADYFDAMRTTEAFLPSLRSLDISLNGADYAGYEHHHGGLLPCCPPPCRPSPG